MQQPRLATIVPLPPADADYRLLVPVLREMSRGVDLPSTFRALAGALRRLTPFDWLAICRQAPRDEHPTLFASLSGRPEWLAVTEALPRLGEEAAAWLLPEVARSIGSGARTAAAGDPAWPVPGDVGALLSVPLPAGAGGSRTDPSRVRSRGALLLGRIGDRPFEPAIVELLEPCAAHLGLQLERTEWLEQFRAVNGELRERVRDLEGALAEARLQASAAAETALSPVVEEPSVAEDEEWITEDAAGHEVLDLVERLAATDLPVLLTGESGTGKELLARTLHRRSPRRAGPWVPVNVAAISGELSGSEFFGHAAGSFTGAKGSRRGLLAEADGGTLFLDEVGDLPEALQPLLLRFLEDGLVRPVGSDRPHRVDVRIVCATNRDPARDVAAGRFREDLYHRIAAVTVRVPPLRARPADLPALARRFLREASRGRWADLPGSWWAVLRRHPWPGNVRELRNAMRAVALMSRGDQLEARFLPESLRRALDREQTLPPASGEFDGWRLDEVERELIRRALHATGGHRGRTAARLGITPRSLYDRIRRFELES